MALYLSRHLWNAAVLVGSAIIALAAERLSAPLVRHGVAAASELAAFPEIERFVARLIPDGDALFQHRAEGKDDMPAHVRTALTGVSLSIPFIGGELVLGTWQGIYLWEHRLAGHKRQVVVHLLGEVTQ